MRGKKRQGAGVLDADVLAGGGAGGAVMLDAHCHLQHDPLFLEYAKTHGEQRFFCMTETPDEYGLFRNRLYSEGFPPNIFLGLGLHPWRVSADCAAACEQVDAFRARLAEAEIEAGVGVGIGAGSRAEAGAEGWARAEVKAGAPKRLAPPLLLVGEVGLDFSAKHVSTCENQLKAFHAVACACNRIAVGGCAANRAAASGAPAAGVSVAADAGVPAVSAAAAGTSATSVAGAPATKVVLSIHAVKSAGQVLDILRESGCLDSCICIFHWFSGTGDQLLEARRAGCLFSFGQRALATKRGRAYAAQIPASQLLYESDAYHLSDFLL